MLSGTYDLPPARPRRPPTEPAVPSLASPHSPGASPKRAYKYAVRTDDRAMNAAFRTQPLGKIVEQICRDFGVGAQHELWPADMVAITQTAADWTAVVLEATRHPNRAPPDPAPAPPPAAQAPSPPKPTPLPPPPDERAAPSQRAP